MSALLKGVENSYQLVSHQTDAADVVSLNSDVLFKPYSLSGEAEQYKTIALLGATEIINGANKWRTVLRLGGEHLVAGNVRETFDGLINKALNSSENQPYFYRDLLEDIERTKRVKGLKFLDSRGVVDYVWLAPKVENSQKVSLIHPSKKNIVDFETRQYTKKILGLFIPLL